MSEPATVVNLLHAALRYASLGWSVIPLHSPTRTGCSCGSAHENSQSSIGKHPRLLDWVKLATIDQETIRKWWKEFPDANIGIVTGARSDLWVLDIDTKKGGEDSLTSLLKGREPLPITVEAQTGSGGRHILFHYPGWHVPNGTDRLGPGLDVRGDGGQIVVAPSMHRLGQRYSWIHEVQPGFVPVAPAPDWILELIRPRPAPPRQPTIHATFPPGSLNQRASRYLASLPPAISGSGGHNALWTATQSLIRGFRLSSSEALGLLVSEYNGRCQPPWSEKELLHKIADVEEKSEVPLGYLADVDVSRHPPPPTSPPNLDSDGLTATQNPPLAHRQDGDLGLGKPPPMSDGSAPASVTSTPALTPLDHRQDGDSAGKSTPTTPVRAEIGDDDGDGPKYVPVKPSLSIPFPDFLQTCDGVTEWLFEPYLFSGGFTLVQGEPKGGKTFFLGWCAVRCALNGLPVLFVEEEGAREVLRDRLVPFLPDSETVRGSLFVAFRKRFRLDMTASVKSLIAEVKRVKAKLVVLDPFIGLHTRKENDSDEMSMIVLAIQEMISLTGCAVMLAHHTRKGESWQRDTNGEAHSADARGSGMLVGAVDIVLSVKGLPVTKRTEGEVRFHLENPDTRVGAPFQRKLMCLRLSDGSMVEEVEQTDDEATESLLARLLPVLPKPPEAISRNALREALRVKKTRLLEAVALGIQQGRIIEMGPHGIARSDQ